MMGFCCPEVGREEKPDVDPSRLSGKTQSDRVALVTNQAHMRTPVSKAPWETSTQSIGVGRRGEEWTVPSDSEYGGPQEHCGN